MVLVVPGLRFPHAIEAVVVAIDHLQHVAHLVHPELNVHRVRREEVAGKTTRVIEHTDQRRDDVRDVGHEGSLFERKRRGLGESIKAPMATRFKAFGAATASRPPEIRQKKNPACAGLS
jgi:hypothetical protein